MQGGIYRFDPPPQQATPHVFPGWSVDNPPSRRVGRDLVGGQWDQDRTAAFARVLMVWAPGASVDNPPPFSMARMVAAFPVPDGWRSLQGQSGPSYIPDTPIPPVTGPDGFWIIRTRRRRG